MLWAIAIVLGVLWAVGVGTSATAGGYIHVLLVGAILLAGYAILERQRGRRRQS